MKNLFPKLRNGRGGYLCRIHFYDEGRGERYFDTEWSVYNETVAGSFTIAYPVDFRGSFVFNNPAGSSIGEAIKVGTCFTVHPIKCNMRGHVQQAGRQIVVTAIEIDEDKQVILSYEYPNK
jgi:hypothetical protein